MKKPYLAAQSFVHGNQEIRKGARLMMTEAEARGFGKLVQPADEEKAAPQPENAMAPAHRNRMIPDSLQTPGKAPAAGGDNTSSSSPAAPASQPTMSNRSASGGKRRQAVESSPSTSQQNSPPGRTLRMGAMGPSGGSTRSD